MNSGFPASGPDFHKDDRFAVLDHGTLAADVPPPFGGDSPPLFVVHLTHCLYFVHVLHCEGGKIYDPDLEFKVRYAAGSPSFQRCSGKRILSPLHSLVAGSGGSECR